MVRAQCAASSGHGWQAAWPRDAGKTDAESGTPGMRLFISIIPRLALLAVLVLFLVQPHLFEPVFRPLVSDGAPVIYDRANLMTLTLQHLGLVALATLLSTLVAVAMAIFVTRRQG